MLKEEIKQWEKSRAEQLSSPSISLSSSPADSVSSIQTDVNMSSDTISVHRYGSMQHSAESF